MAIEKSIMICGVWVTDFTYIRTHEGWLVNAFTHADGCCAECPFDGALAAQAQGQGHRPFRPGAHQNKRNNYSFYSLNTRKFAYQFVYGFIIITNKELTLAFNNIRSGIRQ